MDDIKKKRIFNKCARESGILLNKFINRTELGNLKLIEDTVFLYNNKSSFINNIIISETVDYKIYKELNTSAYIMSFPKLIVIKLNESTLQDFIFLYSESKDYLFRVIRINNVAFVFCISKYRNNVIGSGLPTDVTIDWKSNPEIVLKIKLEKIKLMNWLISNECNTKYTILNLIYHSHLIINRNWIESGKRSEYKITNEYIGKANIDSNIERIVINCINIINKYYINVLPFNYLDN